CFSPVVEQVATLGIGVFLCVRRLRFLCFDVLLLGCAIVLKVLLSALWLVPAASPSDKSIVAPFLQFVPDRSRFFFFFLFFHFSAIVQVAEGFFIAGAVLLALAVVYPDQRQGQADILVDVPGDVELRGFRADEDHLGLLGLFLQAELDQQALAVGDR